MEAILKVGVDSSTGKYAIPEDTRVVQSRVEEQLEILAKLKTVSDNPSKIQKVELKVSPVASTSIDTTKDQAPIEPIKCERIQDSCNQQAKISVASVADYFKERRIAFQAKNLDSMRAPSPPHLISSQPKFPQIPPQLKDFFPLSLPIGRMAEKLKKAAPYNIFFTAVTASPSTHSDPKFITFLDLLDPTLGDLESSVQLNFTVNPSWLLAQYTVAGLNHLPLTIFYGQEAPALENINRMLPNVKSFMIKVPGNYGCHHAKVMLLFYQDKSMRVVISTANLYQDDWDNRVQGVWLSEKLPALSENEIDEDCGESVTNFRKDLVRFLTNYRNSTLAPYIERIKKSNFSSIKVFLITSIPGAHYNDDYGHLRLRTLLRGNSVPIEEEHSVIMQSSSLGNFGHSAQSYLTGEIVKSMSEHTGSLQMKGNPTIKLIYPSLSNVKQSYDGLMGGGCLPYMREAHSRQQWLNQYLYQWKSSSLNCDRAMPHIKSYCRYSETGLFWFVLTSSNMSKSAWGVMKKNALHINSYEVGIAFFPRIVLNGRDVFPLNASQQEGDQPIFKLPYDIPPIPYEQDDVPFCIQDMMEYRQMLMEMI